MKAPKRANEWNFFRSAVNPYSSVRANAKKAANIIRAWRAGRISPEARKKSIHSQSSFQALLARKCRLCRNSHSRTRGREAESDGAVGGLFLKAPRGRCVDCLCESGVWR